MSTPEIGHNLSEIKKAVKEALNNVTQLRADRADINDQIAAIRSALEAKGIKKAAFDMAFRYLSWDPEDREGFDIAYAIVREVGGLPMAEDLFSKADEFADRIVEKKEKLEA